MSVIITSPYKGRKNWSGKEFSDLPAKLYDTFEDAVNALSAYAFYDYNPEKQEWVIQENEQRLPVLHIRHLNTKQRDKLLLEGKIRW